jgi:hypothetical protein
MRILLAAIVAAFFTAVSFAAHAETAETAKPAASKTAKVKCTKRAEAACTAPDCAWTAGKGSAKGKCTKAKKK